MKPAGLRWIIPGVDRMVRMSLREIVMDVPPQEVITRDNVSVKVNHPTSELGWLGLGESEHHWFGSSGWDHPHPGALYRSPPRLRPRWAGGEASASALFMIPAMTLRNAKPTFHAANSLTVTGSTSRSSISVIRGSLMLR